MRRLVGSVVLLVPLVVAVPARAELPVAGCDFNNDDRADLVVGIPRADVGAIVQGGVVEILRGTSSGVGTNPIESLDEDAPGVNGVAEVWDRYGAVVVCGDFNNDGDADIAVGSPDENRFSKRDAGHVSVLYGNGWGIHKQ